MSLNRSCVLLWSVVLTLAGLVGAPRASAQILYDEFNGLSLDPTRWNVQGGGTVTVADGFASLSAPCGGFPYVTTVSNPFPQTGDFYVRVGFRYTHAGGSGNGFGGIDGWVLGQPGKGCWVWQDFCCGGLRAVCGDLVVPIAAAPESNYHVYEWRYISGVYQLFVDGALRATNVSSFRPTGFFIGTPPTGACDWDETQINFVEIGPFLPTPTASTSWGRLKSIYR